LVVGRAMVVSGTPISFPLHLQVVDILDGCAAGLAQRMIFRRVVITAETRNRNWELIPLIYLFKINIFNDFSKSIVFRLQTLARIPSSLNPHEKFSVT
jgi:hypothetical protein